MSTKFKEALAYTSPIEGGLANHKEDSGGITNHGISFRFLSSIPNIKNRYTFCVGGVTEDTIRNLTQEQAELIYFDEFWNKYYEDIDEQKLINRIFDMGVHVSPVRAHKLIQQACLACAGNGEYLVVDGVLGKKTIEAINRFSIYLIAPFRALRVGYYKRIAYLRPKDEKFINGWVKRGYK